MGESSCILKDMSNPVKQEFILEEGNLSDERILPKEELVPQQSHCKQCLDKSDTLLISDVIKVEGVPEESDIHSVIKEELIIENEDVREECNKEKASPKLLMFLNQTLDGYYQNEKY